MTNTDTGSGNNSSLEEEVKKVFPKAIEIGSVLSGDGKTRLGLLVIKRGFEEKTGRKVMSSDERKDLLALSKLREDEGLSEEGVVEEALSNPDVRAEHDRLEKIAEDIVCGYDE